MQSTGSARCNYPHKPLIQQLEYVYERNFMESPQAYMKRVMSSSDMPILLSGLAEKALAAEYQFANQSYQKWVKKDTLRNFKEASRIKTSEWPSLVLKTEGASYEQGYISEDQEKVTLEEFGITFNFTSRMFFQDDLNGLQQFASNGALSAIRKENAKVYSALTGNAVMEDGEQVFSSAHANVGTTGAIDVSSVAEAFKLMRKQMNVGNTEYLSLQPKYLIVGPDNELKARQLLASINPNQVSQANPYQGALELVVDPLIPNNDYYFAAEQSQCPSVVLFNLEGQESPSVESRIQWETDNIQLKVNHKCQAKVMDFRSLVYNAGA